jgi:hypothetical protein
MGTKKIGIVFDNYKVNKFKVELTRIGITSIKTTPFQITTSTLTFKVNDDPATMQLLKETVTTIEAGFQAQKN